MKKLANFFFTLVLIGYSTFIYASNPGEGRWVADEVFRASNAGGSTGLVNMNSAYTIRDGEMSFNIGVASESVGGVDYTQAPVAITYGISNNTELGLATRYIDDNAGTAGVAGGELKLKWRFRNQTEYWPAGSVALSLLFPSGPAALNEVSSWGARLNALMSSESAISDTLYIGIYLDIGATSIDGGADNYLSADIGLLAPISDNKRLQAMLEFNNVSGRANPYLGTADYSAITPGLRYASEAFKLTLGAQSRSTGTTKFSVTLGLEF